MSLRHEYFGREIGRLLADAAVAQALVEVMRKGAGSVVGTVKLLCLLDEMELDGALDALVGEEFEEETQAIDVTTLFRRSPDAASGSERS